MIAALLPGIRDLRVPLANGSLWLTAIWLLFGAHIPPADTENALISQVYNLSDWVGGPASVGALGFIAYLVGVAMSRVTLQQVTDWRGRSSQPSSTTLVNLDDLIHRKFDSARARGVHFGQVLGPFNKLRKGFFDTYTEDVHREFKAEAEAEAYGTGDDPNRIVADRVWKNVKSTTTMAIRTRMLREYKLAEVPFLVANKELFQDYDRLRAEASFLRAIPVPLIVCAIAITYRSVDLLPGWSFLIGGLIVLGALVLAMSAPVRDREALDVLFQSIIAGVSVSPTLKLIDDLDVPSRKLGVAA
jgi:hypothetical protein